jgi:predicted membrane chloride channel (bestrophin family)
MKPGLVVVSILSNGNSTLWGSLVINIRSKIREKKYDQSDVQNSHSKARCKMVLYAVQRDR